MWSEVSSVLHELEWRALTSAAAKRSMAMAEWRLASRRREEISLGFPSRKRFDSRTRSERWRTSLWDSWSQVSGCPLNRVNSSGSQTFRLPQSMASAEHRQCVAHRVD